MSVKTKPRFWDISTPYLQYIQGNGDIKVPDWDYHLENLITETNPENTNLRKFYYGPVYNDGEIDYFVPISHQPKLANKSSVRIPKHLNRGNSDGSLDCCHMVPCPEEFRTEKRTKDNPETCRTNDEIKISELKRYCMSNHRSLNIAAANAFKYDEQSIDFDRVNSARKNYEKLTDSQRKEIFNTFIANSVLNNELVEADSNDWNKRKRIDRLNKLYMPAENRKGNFPLLESDIRKKMMPDERNEMYESKKSEWESGGDITDWAKEYVQLKRPMLVIPEPNNNSVETAQIETRVNFAVTSVDMITTSTTKQIDKPLSYDEEQKMLHAYLAKQPYNLKPSSELTQIKQPDIPTNDFDITGR